MALEPPKHRPKPGLKAIHEGREARLKGKYNRPTTGVWILVFSAFVASLVAYKLISAHQLDSSKNDLLMKQRAVTSSIGAEWFPMRDKLEALTLDAARDYKGDLVDPEVARWDFRSLPGLYLRTRVADAKDTESLRRAAIDSPKDEFQACLLREPNAAAARGERDAGAFSDQPWNLGQAYGATRVMSDDWTAEVKASEEPMRLRVFEQQYDKAIKSELPLAADLLKRAQFYLLVLDEDDDAAKPMTDGGAMTEEALQMVPHPARVHLVNLRTGKEVLRLRRSAGASFVFAGEHTVSDPELKSAMQRQVNNCALAKQVNAAITATQVDGGTAR